MTKLTLEELKVFLRNKPGYLKEGGRRLKNRLANQGFETTIRECKVALREIREELKLRPSFDNDLKVLFYDIEVSYGLAKAWRPAWKTRINYSDFVVHPKIICISYKWQGEDEVHTVRWDSKQDDKTLLELFIPVLNEADFIVAHNGDKFDLPWIKTRALFHGLDMLPKYASVDTLKIVKADHRFPSNRLDDIGDYLGVGRKLPTGMKLWEEVFNGNEEALEKMIEYCEQDVLLLEEVYDKLATMTFNKTHAGVLNGGTKQSSPYTGSRNIEMVKKITTKAGTPKFVMKDMDNGKYFEMSHTDYKKFKLAE